MSLLGSQDSKVLTAWVSKDLNHAIPSASHTTPPQPKTEVHTVTEIPLDWYMPVFTDKKYNCTEKTEAAGFFVPIKL